MPAKNRGRKMSNLGIVFACLSWVVLPIVFGPAAVILGLKGYFLGDEKRGIIAVVLGVVFSVSSTIVAMVFMG